MKLVQSKKIGHDRIYKMFPGLKPNPRLDILSIWDMFCECGTVLHPTHMIKKFRQKGHSIIVELFVAKCVKCKKNFDVRVWKEIIWQRRTGIRKMLVIDGTEQIDLLSTSSQECSKCGKVTKHYVWTRQLRSSDESETTFYRCSICNKTMRESI